MNNVQILTAHEGNGYIISGWILHRVQQFSTIPRMKEQSIFVVKPHICCYTPFKDFVVLSNHSNCKLGSESLMEFQIRQLWRLLRESRNSKNRKNTYMDQFQTWTLTRKTHTMWPSFNQSNDLNLWMGCIS